MTEKFEPQNLKEAWLYAWTILEHLNTNLGTPYTIRKFGLGGSPLKGVEDPGFERKTDGKLCRIGLEDCPAVEERKALTPE